MAMGLEQQGLAVQLQATDGCRHQSLSEGIAWTPGPLGRLWAC